MGQKSIDEIVCQLCDGAFKTKTDLKIDQISVHQNKEVLKCHVCQKQFIFPKDFKRHEDVHSDERPFSCDLCQKSFKSDCAVQTHKETHIIEADVSCGICGKVVLQKKYLDKHMKFVHSSDAVKNHECLHCEKRFFHLSKLEQHALIHTSIKPFCCMLCQKTFRHKVSLNSHMKHSHDDASANSQENGRRFSCSVCGTSFQFEHYLRKHKLAHVSEKPYQCLKCDKNFKTNGFLQ